MVGKFLCRICLIVALCLSFGIVMEEHFAMASAAQIKSVYIAQCQDNRRLTKTAGSFGVQSYHGEEPNDPSRIIGSVPTASGKRLLRLPADQTVQELIRSQVQKVLEEKGASVLVRAEEQTRDTLPVDIVITRFWANPSGKQQGQKFVVGISTRVKLNKKTYVINIRELLQEIPASPEAEQAAVQKALASYGAKLKKSLPPFSRPHARP